MPLDPEVKAYLNDLAAGPSAEAMGVAEARRQMQVSSALLGPLEPMAETHELTLPGPAGDVRARLHRPAYNATLPCIMFFHGGGWVVGDIDTHDGYCRTLANATGAAVMSVDYRLAPEHKYPAAADDAYAATCWVAAHALELGLDASRLAVAGDSAGGNLAAVTALRARDEEGPRLAFQLLIYPVTDFNFETASYLELAEGYFLTRSGMRWFWLQYLPHEDQGTEAMASPLRADLSGLPPALIMTSEYDPLRDEGEAYARRLEEAGVPVTLRRYPGVIHGFARRHRMWATSRRALDETTETVRQALGLA